MIEKLLSKLHDRKYVQLCGNGTTSLYLILLSLNLKKQYVGLPNSVCSSVLLPIYFSGNIPVFLDVDKETLGISIKDLKDKINYLDCVIAVHSYGSVCEIEKIEKICKRAGVYLIEDAAVAQGTKYKERTVGSFGIASILSFGVGKIIDCNHGGAILTDDLELKLTIQKTLDGLVDYNEKNDEVISKISKYHTFIYNQSFGNNINDYSQKFKKLCLDNSNYFLSKFNKEYRICIEEKLSNLSRFIDVRKKNADYLFDFFFKNKNENVSYFNPKYDSTYWRFNLFINQHRNEVFSFLLKKKYLVSSWYHPVDLLFERRDESKVNTPISDWVGKNILNIWVNELVDRTYLDLISNDILTFLS